MSAPFAVAEDQPGSPLRQAGLVVLASASWPGGAGQNGAAVLAAETSQGLPPVAGFILSSFSPLAASVAESCLRGYFGAPPADPDRAARTGIVLASDTGDIATAVHIGRAVDEGRRVPPLLFYQSNQNAITGHIAARWGLTGPVVCTIPAADALADALDSATALIEDGDAGAALVIVVHQESIADYQGKAVSPGGPAGPPAHEAGDHGVALLVGPQSWRPPAEPGRAGQLPHGQELSGQELSGRELPGESPIEPIPGGN
jgi:hypothetical protein